MQRETCLSMEEIAAMGEAIAETAAIIDVATHRFLTQLREFDRVAGWHRAGALSCAHWLSWRIGMDLGAAREKVRVARKLDDLPVIAAALKKGEVSYSKVRAMTRVATAENEAELLGMARCATGAQLEKICRLKRMVNALAGESAKDVEGRRYVVERTTEDGMVSIQLRLLPEEAARVMKAFEVAGSGNRADGAVAVADAALGGKLDAGSVRPPVEVVVHVQAADLEGRTELGDGVSAEVSRRLLCDAGVVPMLEDDEGRTIDVGGRRGRSRRPSGARSTRGTAAAGSRGAPTGSSPMHTTSSTGSTAARPAWRTRYSCVGGTTGISTSMGSRSSGSARRWSSATRAGWWSRRRDRDGRLPWTSRGWPALGAARR
jgi:hypothetical protein